MEISKNNSEILQSIQDVIDQLGEDSEPFAETLRHEHIPHLSFSQISTVEFCQYRYFLQYVQMRDPDPIPDYFTKGKLFHQIVATFYQKSANSDFDTKEQAFQIIAENYEGQNQRHLENAFLVHLENYWRDYEVVAVEKPFTMTIDPNLPPCVGVIDLILKQDDKYVLVDHKTGRNFYPQDELQMAIYVEYMHRLLGEAQYEFFYDEYRWINNLNRIRKPAFQRIEVTLESNYWQDALTRIRNGFTMIDQIKTNHYAERNGECFLCPYRWNCRKFR
jgi:ATP-dependent exoDNAse (exonuclease V) beta subunit